MAVRPLRIDDSDGRTVAGNGRRTGVIQFEHPNALQTVGPFAISTRRTFSPPVLSNDWRAHVRNRDFLGNTNSNGDMASWGLTVGEAVLDANGELTGATVATPTVVQSPTTLLGASELITPWSSFALNERKTYFLCNPINVASGKNLAIGGGRHWNTATPGDYLVANPASMTRTDNQGVLDIYLECRVRDDGSPTMLVISNSASGGGNVGSVANRAEMGAWPQLWARRNRGFAASLAVGGAIANDFGAASVKWDYYSTLDVALNVDVAVLLATGSSDLLQGASVATVQARYVAIINKVRAIAPSANIVLTTLPPRGDSTGTPETNRQTMNTWLSTCPAGANYCVDIDGPFTDWASPGRLRTVFAGAPPSADIIHWSERTHQTVSALMPSDYQSGRASS